MPTNLFEPLFSLTELSNISVVRNFEFMLGQMLCVLTLRNFRNLAEISAYFSFYMPFYSFQ
jgi:hypothetical protein